MPNHKPTNQIAADQLRNPAIGQRLRRVEDEPLVAGRGRFVSDIQLDDALHLSFLRSPFARGFIGACDLSGAKDMPGVVAVYHGDDVAHLGNLSVNPILETVNPSEFPVLANKNVMAVGQPVIAVVAETQPAGVDAAEAIYFDIDTEALPQRTGNSGTAAVAQKWTSGDLPLAFREADHVVTACVNHPRLAPSPMETRAVAADFDRKTDKITVWLSTQTPHRARKELAQILGLDINLIRVIAPDVGGAFGMKASLYPEDVMVVWTALQLRRAVRWTATRSEDFLSATHGRGTQTSGALAVSQDGRFLALRAEVTCPLGHWLPSSAAIPAWNAARILPGPYDIDTLAISTRGVLSNTAPVGIYRGAGRPEAAALMERLVDEATRVTGLDAFEIRAINLLPREKLPKQRPTGIRLDSGDYSAALKMLRELSGYDELRQEQTKRRENSELVGLGISFYVEPCGQGWESAKVRLNPDGTIQAATGTSSQGHGRQTAFAQIVADVFEVSPDLVSIASGDTETCPEGIGALASRSTAIGGSALLQAARDVRQQYDTAPDKDQIYEANIVYESDGEAWGYGCYLAVISIDPDTGVIKIEKITCVDDAGVAINPMLVEGQIMGGIAQGIGEAMMEQIVYNEDGQLLTGSLMDYALPRADDVPPVKISKLETASPLNLLGAKGIGEGGTIGAPAAILNAAFDALRSLGVQDLQMPLTAEKIWQAMNAAAKETKK